MNETENEGRETPAARPSASPGALDDITGNKPLITGIAMLAGVVTGGLTTLVGGILAYVFKGEVEKGSWEETHYRYHIRTFWGSVIGVVVSTILTIVLIGFLMFALLAVWLVVRCVLALIKAGERKPMPSPDSWLF
ncbi:hypothetical protein KCG44_03215 [Pacificimonas sp. WHA3]|uniref:Transmembrane protein n=1 Tax=Pacificimonas pallii TaxID=2827236 RepID=A0ABS6SBJ9_9SPHN|nr:hypothetical protein [Pacificimonas pallii]MBV7255792.1 hypothetical protein [Pacificimonas pallii]